MVGGEWCVVYVVRCLVSGDWCLVTGVSCLVFGVWRFDEIRTFRNLLNNDEVTQ